MLNLGMNLQRLAAKQVEFTPASLFNNGEAGVWYDPSAASGSLDWQRNLLEYTESFDNNYWTRLQSTVTPNVVAAPDGSVTGDKLIDNTANSGHNTSRSISMTAGASYTASCYVKQGGRRWVALRYMSGGAFSTNYIAFFDLQNGTATNSPSLPATSFSITDVGNGWYRCSITQAADSVGSGVFAIFLSNDGVGTSYVGDGTSGIYIWGAQLEEASTASSYQPILNTFESAFKAAFPSHTLYQDYQGVTPVTAVGEPVGLMLDKSEGLAQGPELVTNGDFATDSDWTKDSEWTIANGVATFDDANNANLQQFNMGLVIGKSYLFRFNITSGTTPNFALFAAGSSDQYAPYTVYSVGTHQLVFTCAGGTGIRIAASKFVGSSFSIDNVSVTEIQGSHATQPTSTKRPIYARHPEGGIRNLLNYTEQLDNGLWAKISTGGAAVSVIPSSYAAPDGTYSATQVLGLDTSGSRLDQATALPALPNKTYTYSVWLRGSGVIKINASTTSGVGGGTEISVTLTSTWTRHDVTNTFNSSPTGNVRIHGVITRVTGTAPEVHMWSPQLEEATEASNYQKRVTDIDVTESGVGEVYYLKFDGTDDGMSINNLTSGNTPLTALFGYSAENCTAIDYLFDTISGRTIFGIEVGKIRYYDGGWLDFNADGKAIKVLTYDLVEDNAKIRIDGTQEYSDTTYDQRGINGATALFSGYDVNDAFVKGNMYQTILRAAESTDEEIAKAETYVANKTGLKAQVDGIATLDLNFGANTYTAKNSNGGVI